MGNGADSKTGSDSPQWMEDGKRVQRPLSGHAELEIISERVGQGWVNEYRVYNFRSLPSGRVVKGDRWAAWDWVLVAASLWLLVRVDWGGVSASAWEMDTLTRRCLESPTILPAALCILLLSIKSRIRVYQSITPLPGLGLQLSTTNYLTSPWFRRTRPVVLSTSKTFVPLSDISTVVINEGLTRWSIRYFLAVVQRRGRGILIAFEAVQPRHAVLREVYHGIREQLFDEWADD